MKAEISRECKEPLNSFPAAEADKLTQSSRYERNDKRQGYRSGHYSRTPTTTSGDVALNLPRLKGIRFAAAIMERYRRREMGIKSIVINSK